MALPSIILLLAFVGSVAGTFIGFVTDHHIAIEAWLKSFSSDENVQCGVVGLFAATVAAVTAVAASLHWRRFTVRITVAAAAVTFVAVALSLIVGLIPPAEKRSSRSCSSPGSPRSPSPCAGT